MIDYAIALQRQDEYVTSIRTAARSETIVFCSHPPVVTLGRRRDPSEIQGWTGPVVETNRGGRATYHGPNQLVIYPLIDLRKDRALLRARDVHGYLALLEQVTANALQVFGLEAQPGSKLNKPDQLSYTGVWVNGYKVASVGVAIKGWISSHGIAVNVFKDPLAFVGIQPCGFQASLMASIEDLRSPIAIEDLRDALMRGFRDGLALVA